MYLKRNDINCLKWHGFPSCPLIALLNRWNLLGTPTCLVPKHLQIRKVEHPKHNAFQRFRRDLRSTSGRLEFIWEPKLFHILGPSSPSLLRSCWLDLCIYRRKYTERKRNTVETVEITSISFVCKMSFYQFHFRTSEASHILLLSNQSNGHNEACHILSNPVSATSLPQAMDHGKFR